MDGNMILNYGSGGGGTALNFKVVRYDPGAELPASAAENAIAVFTNVDIAGWYFSATQPENMKQGELWFSTGVSSAVAFNALKKNGIEVYPLSAKQYVDGELVEVEAESYQGGEWVEWITSIIQNGVTDYTIKTMSKAWSANNYQGNNPVVEEKDGYILFHGSGEGYGAFYVEVDATGKNTLIIEGEFGESANLAIWSSVGNYITSNMIASLDISNSVGGSLDISALEGNVLVGVTETWKFEHKIVNMYMK